MTGIGRSDGSAGPQGRQGYGVNWGISKTAKGSVPAVFSLN
jgi:hypothetical protein